MPLSLEDIFGYSDRGMQESDEALGAAAGTTSMQAQAKLRAMAKARNLQSSTLGLIGSVTATAIGTALPIPALPAGLAISASVNPPKNYKPVRLMVSIDISAVDSTTTPQTNGASANGPNALYLVGASSNGDNVMPLAQGNGVAAGSGAISCSAYANVTVGGGISWKTIWANSPAIINFIMSPAIVRLLPAWTPVGLTTYVFTVSASIFGPMWDPRH